MVHAPVDAAPVTGRAQSYGVGALYLLPIGSAECPGNSVIITGKTPYYYLLGLAKEVN